MRNILRAASELTALSIFLPALLFTTNSFAQSPEPEITEFRFEVQYNTGKIQESIIADIYGDTLIVAIVPYQQSDFNLVATFNAGSSETVKVNGIDQASSVTVNDFSVPVTYVISSGANLWAYKVRVIRTGLPLVYVYTENAAPILTKEDYVNGTIKIYPTTEGATILNSQTQIRGRGNTTWTLDKKPYRLKLTTAASVLGMPSDRDWVLLANHVDRTLMRNSLAYYLGSEMNLEYTPRTTHVDLVLNGVYQGNYLIGEHVKVDKDRVNIKELDEDDIGEDVITGGYFLELDNFRDGLFFELGSGLPIVIKDPEDLPQVQHDYIKNYMQQTEDVIFSENFADPVNGYAKYIDVETFIEYYWVQEVLKNIDGRDGSSIFYYKDRGQKLKMGPLWDFDVASGNASVNTGEDPENFYVRESKWFKRLFQDPAFKSAAEARWVTLKSELLSTLPGYIDSMALRLEKSQQQNFYKWNVLNTTIWPSPAGRGSYKIEVAHLKEWLATRIAWIDNQINPELKSFSLSAPANNSKIIVLPNSNNQVAFSWNRSSAGASYKVLVDRITGDFSAPIATWSPVANSPDTVISVAISELYKLFDEITDKDSVRVKWTVHASLGGKKAIAQNEFQLRLINGVMGNARLHSPTANATTESLSPAFKWFKTYLAEKYDLQISITEGFDNVVVNKTGLSDTTITITESLAEQKKHYWRTRSFNAGGQSVWSEVRSFTTPLVTAIADVNYGVSAFPNPTSNELYVTIPSYVSIDNAELVDTTGRRAISSGVSPGATTRIDVGHLQRGMYILILRGGIEKSITSKVILR